MSSGRGRVIVIGLDGMDPELLSQWLAAGRLPHLARLAALGGWWPLATTNPAESPVAWASFATGLNPGKHGIFDFLHRDPQTYLPRVAPLTIRTRADGNGLEAINHRAGQTIWGLASAAGKRCLVLRVPGACPPESLNGEMLSGLGTPDILGTWGSSFLYTSAPQPGGAQTILLLEGTERIETAISGPQEMQIPLVLRREADCLHLDVQQQACTLRPGEWSPWITLRFGAWSAITQFYLRSLAPHLSLYLAPLQIDPRAPCLPLTYPPAFAAELAQEHGLYNTLGWPEDASGLSEGRLDERAFLDQVYRCLAEQEDLLLRKLSERRDDLVIAVMEAADRVQHFFWQYQDTQHPLYAAEGAQLYGDEIARCYRRLDETIGRVQARLDAQDTLLVLSDHGFKPVYRWLHLNTWLREAGYLAQSATGQIDWRRTRAYAIGLSKVYINLRGRERQGIVEPGRPHLDLCREIAGKLLELRDESEESVVQQVYVSREIYNGDKLAEAGDLVIGLRSGYRTSSQTALGRLGEAVITENRKKWGADHCSIDPSLVPGVLLCSRPLDTSAPSILDLAPTILHLLGVPAPFEMDSCSLISA
jgi:predicted AlkP superfamily phosphohydrolase/phosphomutase